MFRNYVPITAAATGALVLAGCGAAAPSGTTQSGMSGSSTTVKPAVSSALPVGSPGSGSLLSSIRAGHCDRPTVAEISTATGMTVAAGVQLAGGACVWNGTNDDNVWISYYPAGSLRAAGVLKDFDITVAGGEKVVTVTGAQARFTPGSTDAGSAAMLAVKLSDGGLLVVLGAATADKAVALANLVLQ